MLKLNFKNMLTEFKITLMLIYIQFKII